MDKLDDSSEESEGIEEAAAMWAVRLADAPDDGELASAFRAWSNGCDERLAAYRKAERLLGTASEPAAHGEEALDRVARRLQQGKPKKRRRFIQPALAASVAIFVLAGVGFWILSPEGTKLATETAEQRELALPDMTSVALDAETQLRYNFTEEKRQVILLAGAAVFDIAGDPRPFEVRVGDHVIRDIGTIFSVKINDSMLNRSEDVDTSFTVSVEEGEVEVSRVSEESDEKVSIVHGQEVEFEESEDPVVQESPKESFASWRNQLFHYRNRSLDRVLADLQRHHERRIVLADSSLADEEISGILNVSDLENALVVLSRALPISFVAEGEGEVIVDRSL
ncbi:MAG: FecR domain-containing protein [Verrucomicrobiota bacterium]